MLGSVPTVHLMSRRFTCSCCDVQVASVRDAHITVFESLLCMRQYHYVQRYWSFAVAPAPCGRCVCSRTQLLTLRFVMKCVCVMPKILVLHSWGFAALFHIQTVASGACCCARD